MASRSPNRDSTRLICTGSAQHSMAQGTRRLKEEVMTFRFCGRRSQRDAEGLQVGPQCEVVVLAWRAVARRAKVGPARIASG